MTMERGEMKKLINKIFRKSSDKDETYVSEEEINRQYEEATKSAKILDIFESKYILQYDNGEIQVFDFAQNRVYKRHLPMGCTELKVDANWDTSKCATGIV